MLQASDSTRPLLAQDNDTGRETTETFEIAAETTGPTERLANSCGNKDVGYCTMTVAVLLVINSLSCVLLVFIGDKLGDLETMGQYNYDAAQLVVVDGSDYGEEIYIPKREYQREYYRRRERRETIMAVVSMVVVLLVNLGTIYFLCKTFPSAQGSRSYKAGVAVFGCFRSRREYEEANVPASEVLFNIWARSKPCEISRQALLRGLAFGFVAFCAFAIAFILDVKITPQGLLVFLCVPATLLWVFLCKLASQGDFFADEEFMASISGDAECSEDQEGGEGSLQLSSHV